MLVHETTYDFGKKYSFVLREEEILALPKACLEARIYVQHLPSIYKAYLTYHVQQEERLCVSRSSGKLLVRLGNFGWRICKKQKKLREIIESTEYVFHVRDYNSFVQQAP